MKYQGFKQIHTALYDLFTPSTTMKEAYNLDRMFALMDLLGNPQNKLSIVHVAGTSGKTSTSYYLASLLQATGKKVGLTVSPHIDEINERVQFNLEPLSEQTFTKYFNEFVEIPGITELTPSYFEAMVAFAYWVFEKEKVDYAVVEVGIGGLGDATNVIAREDKVCVITDIGIDHIQVLGDTIEKITNQKAGIITPHNLVFVNRQADEIMQVIEDNVAKQHATLEIIEKAAVPVANDLPDFQKRNWTLAYITARAIAKRDDLPVLSEELLRTTTTLVVPARMEVRSHDDKLIILDGSHNKQKLQALCRAVKQKYRDKSVALLVAFIAAREDQLESALDELLSVSDDITITEFVTEQDFRHQSVEATIVAAAAKKVGFKHVAIKSTPEDALQTVLDSKSDIVLITGSFYLLNHVRPYIN